MTPATWSMVQVFLSDAMATASIPPYVGYGRVGGRIYLNVSVMSRLSGAVGVSERRFRSLTEEVFGQASRRSGDSAGHGSRLTILRASSRWRCTCSARRDATPGCSTTTWPGIRERCDQRRAEIAAIDHGPDLAQLWRM